MAKYIDCEALKKFLHQEDFDTPDERWRPESEFAQMIDSVPAADAVEVDKVDELLQSIFSISLAELKRTYVWVNTIFCSYGERKGDCNNCNHHSNKRKGVAE